MKQFDLIHGWGLLVVLDSCRFDYFQEENRIPGRLFKVVSSGNTTRMWLMNTFPNRYDDIVYVAANPYVSLEGFGVNHFYKLEEVWKYGWDEEKSTVPPQEVNKAVERVLREHPNKRVVAHYIQPHEPYIGKIELPVGFWDVGEIKWCGEQGFPPDLVREAYRENLRLVLRHVEKLTSLGKRTVITSDHGEMLGEDGLWGHPVEAGNKKPLLWVPWLIVGSD